MSSLPTVLIFTYPEHGQANVNLAISYELALAGVNVHVASFPSLRTRVSRLQELIDRHASRSSGKTTGSVVFHECKGVTSNYDALEKCGINVTNLPHPPGVLGALEGYSKACAMLFPWGQEANHAVIAICEKIIASTRPDVVGVDPLFYAAQDACKLANQRFMVISPTSLRAEVVNAQPYLAAFWKYPIISSGFPFPIKWWQIPLNIYLHIRLIIQLMTSPNVSSIRALRRSLGLDNVIVGKLHSGVTYLCPALPQIDFPFTVIPKEIHLCGPIILPFDPLEESDPGMMKWLDNGPTVLVNLGSHVISDEKLAKEMASAFRILLDHDGEKGKPSEIQILWKVRADEHVQKVIKEIIGKEMKEGKVKVASWLDSEPVSILQHPNIVCTVHHGGANSFYEGVWSGIPHIVLPVWYDTYDNARRAEYLNIGIYGSKSSAPGVRAEEFGRALVRVTDDSEEAEMFRRSAKHLRDVCRRKGNGRELASMAILKEVSTKW